MALFRGVKGRARGSYDKSRRSSDRNFHYAQAGRSGQTRGGLKLSFTSSRVNHQTQDDAEQRSDETSKLDDEPILDSDGVSSDDGDEETAATTVKPYKVLLQSLNGTSQRGQPPRKIQKKNDFEVVENTDSREKDLDLVLEPEEIENFGIEELIDEDRDDEIAEGMS